MLIVVVVALAACSRPVPPSLEANRQIEPSSTPSASAPAEPSALASATANADASAGADALTDTDAAINLVPDPTPATPAPLVVAQERPPMRGAWVHLFDDTLKSRESIAQLVDELAAAEANAIVAQVARRHDAYYTSEVLPPTPDPTLEPGLDVLAELTSAAHAAGLQVHAWISLAPTWHEVYRDLPVPEGWITAEHGMNAPEAERWVTRTIDGEWSDYLDPGLPAVREHLAAIVTELVERYPVDGVHLDYVRYASDRHGYHPDALARYNAETGATGVPAPQDPAWSDWRREQTRAVVERTRRALNGRDVALSAAAITWGPGPHGAGAGGFEATRAYTEALQDWPGWARDGLLDAVLPMNYFRDHVEEQAGWFAQWMSFQSRLAEEGDTLVVPGIAGYLNSPAAAQAQIAAAMRAADGAMMYSYQQPTEDGTRGVWQLLVESDWGAPGP